jgi:hypothetical protein
MLHKIKGTGLMIIKSLLKKMGPAAETRFFENLNPESKNIWKSNFLASSWVLVEMGGTGAPIYESARVLFPGSPRTALIELGKVMAKEGLPRFYQVFLSIPSPQFVFKSSAQMWRRFYDEGEAGIKELGPNHIIFFLKNFPDYDANMRIYMIGFLLGLGEMLKMSDVTVALHEQNSEEWQWEVHWK